MQMFGWEKDQYLCNSLLNFCMKCEWEVAGQEWRDAAKKGGKKEKHVQGQILIVTVDWLTQTCAHIGMHAPICCD